MVIMHENPESGFMVCVIVVVYFSGGKDIKHVGKPALSSTVFFESISKYSELSKVQGNISFFGKPDIFINYCLEPLFIPAVNEITAVIVNSENTKPPTSQIVLKGICLSAICCVQ